MSFVSEPLALILRLYGFFNAGSFRAFVKKRRAVTILQEIQKWSATLPAWQQDTIVRLFRNAELSPADDDDLYALLKADHGIADPHGRVAKKLEADQVAGAQRPEILVQLVAIKNLENVNALASGQTLPIGEEGLTIIYGDNGSGKSGYSRVLKKACRARDQREEILPDAKLPPGAPGKAKAAFDLIVDGAEVPVEWTDGEVPPEHLASIAIFDSRCARAYIDEQNDFCYVPYGLDILEGLARTCNRLKARIETEHGDPVDTSAFAVLAGTPTAVGSLLSSLSAASKTAAVETLAKMHEKEIERHQALGKLLKEGNPLEKAKQLRQRIARITRLLERCTDKASKVSAEEVRKLRELVSGYKAAKEAADLAAKTFRDTPGQLPGTGGEAWQTLLEAAKKFAVESHPGKAYPHLGADSDCPLCQQPLGTAVERLIGFEAFVQQDLETAARTKRAEAETAYKQFQNLQLSIGLTAELKEDLDGAEGEMSKACEALQEAITTRHAAVKTACGDESKWGQTGEEPSVAALGIQGLIDNLSADAETLEKASDPETRAALERDFSELNARVQLQAVKAAVLATISKLVLQKKLKGCLSSLKTNSISLKSTELSEKVVSAELAAKLNDEFKALSVGELHVSLESFTAKGKTLHKLALKLPGTKNPNSILSEGEQRAIAIASFLAEVNVGGGKGGIIFDDPVSSLDHRRRDVVAARLAQEARKRQVIVFTHDVYFLCILQQEAEKAEVPARTLSLHRTAEGFGVADNDLPFEGAKTSARIGMLRQMLVKCEKLHKNGDEKAYRREARDLYYHLRLTWERAVEEVLFGNVVIRFREGVETNRLKVVSVEDGDYAIVDAGMTNASKYAHDKAAMGMVAMPAPDKIASDIADLDNWRGLITKRNEATGKRRG